MTTYVIAEAGVNHNGSLDLARELVDVAAEAGADAVKFQTFQAQHLASVDAPKAAYQQTASTAEESQFEMLAALQLSETHHFDLVDYCSERGIQLLSSPFDAASVDLVLSLDVPLVKIPSGEITNGPLLWQIARSGKAVILSTGMSTLGEVEQALGVLACGYLRADLATPPSIESFQGAYASDEGRRHLMERVTLLHCTSEYPAPVEEVNLRAMEAMRTAFALPMGLSDHTPGWAIAVAAVALGAQVIEKHFTIDRTLPGPDHQASLEPDELRQMIDSIRQVERALGVPQKHPTRSELSNRAIVRKSIVAARNIEQGELFSAENLAVKRPGGGISPMNYWSMIGRPADRPYSADERIAS